MKYKTKMIITGNVVECYQYEKAVLRGKDLKSARAGNGEAKSKLKVKRDLWKKGNLKGRKVKLFIRYRSEQQSAKRFFDALREDGGAKSEMGNNGLVGKGKSLHDSLRRTRNTVRRTINSNIGKWGEKEKFLTLTFEENKTEQAECNKLFSEFVKKLSYSIFKTRSALKYLCVVERQSRGAIHYHVLFFNLPYKPVGEIEKIWGHGFVRVNEIKENDNLGAYMSKYMSKEMVENSEKSAKEKDKKLYFVSRGLHKPIECVDSEKKDEEQIKMFLQEMDEFKVYETVFENEHLGRIEYKQYNMNRRK